MSYITFKNICKSYDNKTQVLKGIDLEVEEGELLTLLGPSGCGKSTLLRCLAGLEQVQQGHILLEGRDITDLDARQRQIGMVFQQYSLFPNMTVEQNMAFGLKIQRLSKAEINDRITEALAMVGLQDKADAYPAQLSGGQQQRVALARAIVTRPKVLLLDEPLSAIDAKLRKSLQVEIRRIQKQLNITTIFVTHDQGHVRPYLPAELRQDRADGYPHCHLHPPPHQVCGGLHRQLQCAGAAGIWPCDRGHRPARAAHCHPARGAEHCPRKTELTRHLRY